MLTRKQKMNLYEQACIVSKNCYSPYSSIAVGAAVLTSAGKVYLGVNVENASYGLTICAERSAVVAAISAGERELVAIAVKGQRPNTTPCGACRQFIIEFGAEIDVIYEYGGEIKSTPIRELVPDYFRHEESSQ